MYSVDGSDDAVTPVAAERQCNTILQYFPNLPPQKGGTPVGLVV